MFLLAKYNTQTTFVFPVVKASSTDLAASADWTPATGDTKVSKDGGNVANTTNNPAAVGGTGSVLWSLTLTATELSAAEVVVQIVDSATKAIVDQVLRIYTYGNASAKIIPDWSDTVRMGLTALPNVASGSAGAIITSGTGTAQLNVSSGNLAGSVASVAGAVGSVTSGVNTVQLAGQTVTAAAAVTFPTSVASPTNITAGTITTVTNLTNAPTAGDLTATMKASVNAEIVDALNTDTYAEPGQGNPAATATLVQKIGYLYKAWRNKSTQTSAVYSLYADDTTTVDQKASVADDGSTLTRGEVSTGP